jgi:hypothetical protein
MKYLNGEINTSETFEWGDELSINKSYSNSGADCFESQSEHLVILSEGLSDFS